MKREITKIKERILIERIKKEDAKAFEKVYNVYVEKIYTFARYKVPRNEEAEDVVQNSFIKLWQYLTKAKNSSKKVTSLQALLYSICRNLINDFYRQKKETQNIDDYAYKISDEKAEDNQTKIDIDLKISQAKKQLQQLENSDYREVVELKYIHQLSNSEIAEVMGKTEQNVRTMLHRALKKIKSNFNSDEK